MEIHYTGRNIEVTPALKNYMEEKLKRLAHRHTNIISLHVTFHIENVTQSVEATAHVYGVDIHARADEKDMYAAIDIVVDRLITQITKHKEKMIDKHR